LKRTSPLPTDDFHQAFSIALINIDYSPSGVTEVDCSLENCIGRAMRLSMSISHCQHSKNSTNLVKMSKQVQGTHRQPVVAQIAKKRQGASAGAPQASYYARNAIEFINVATLLRLSTMVKFSLSGFGKMTVS
jgi:hypothetical protein